MLALDLQQPKAIVVYWKLAIEDVIIGVS